MTDVLGFGPEKRRQGNLDILAGKVTFRCASGQPSMVSDSHVSPRGCRDAFREMLESVSANGHSFESCKEELKKSESFVTPNSLFPVDAKRE